MRKMPYALWTRGAVAELIVQRFGIRLPVRTMGLVPGTLGFHPAQADPARLRAVAGGGAAVAGRGVPGDCRARQGRRRRDSLGRRDRIALDDGLLAVAREAGLSAEQARRELDACVDWHRVNGRRRVDWQATARNWLRKSAQLGGSRPAGLFDQGVWLPRPSDHGAWQSLGQRFGLRARPGEEWAAFQARIRANVERVREARRARAKMPTTRRWPPAREKDNGNAEGRRRDIDWHS